MLKIKDIVDLKELEKFGFETSYGSCWWWKTLRKSKEECWEIAVSKDDNRIQLCYGDEEPYGVSTYIERELDVLYDLIEVGLVEKVSE